MIEKICYKIVNATKDEDGSEIMISSGTLRPYTVVYEIGKWANPVAAGTPLFCIKTLEAARYHNGNGKGDVILKCKYSENFYGPRSRRVPRMFYMYFFEDIPFHTMSEWWQDEIKENNHSFFSNPCWSGTILVKSLLPLEVVK